MLGLLIPTLILCACADVDAVLNPNIKVYDVPGASMEPGIQPGAKIEALRVTNYKPHLGDVVIALTPKAWGQGPGFKTIRRVLGTPGEQVSCDPKKQGGRVVVNGKPLDESSYLPPKVVDNLSGSMAGPYMPSTAPCETPFSVTVPAGDLWLMGDNRGDSSDSRAHMQDPGGPFVPVANVVAVYKPR